MEHMLLSNLNRNSPLRCGGTMRFTEFLFFFFALTLTVDKVSMLTHTYSHKP